MLSNEPIFYFPFWKPITFEENPGQTSLKKFAWMIGSLADQYASLSRTKINVNAERFSADKIYFKSDEIKKVPLWLTILKLGSYIFSFGTLPLVALTIKFLYKKHLNDCKIVTQQSPNEVFCEKQLGKSKIVLLYGSITEENTDAIVNAANAGLWAGSGVCGAIHKAAGDTPFDECVEILEKQDREEVDCGDAVITSSGDLAPKIKAIVHAIGPDYNKKEEKAKGSELLTAAYRNSLEIAIDPKLNNELYTSEAASDLSLHSISFPSISTGIFKAPLKEAASIAINTVKDFLEKHPDSLEEVRFVFLPLEKDPITPAAYQEVLESL